MTSRNWCFTIFCDKICGAKDNMDLVLNGAYAYNMDYTKLNGLEYLVCQVEECPSSKKLHLQGYCEFNMPVRMSAIQKFYGNKCHCEKRRGTQEEAIKYCKKEDSRLLGIEYFEYGSPIVGRGNKVKMGSIIQTIKSGGYSSFKELLEDNETEGIRYMKALERLWMMYKPQTKLFEFDTLLPVQKEMERALEEQNSRQITWIYDEIGGCGKSEFSNYLEDKGETYWCSGGSYSDIFCAFSKEDINKIKYVCIDLMKCTKSKYIPYAVMESFKNGKAFSSKYDSTKLIFPKMKVIVLSNMLPNEKGLSKDRWDIRKVSRNEGNTILIPYKFSVTKLNIEVSSDEE